MCFGTTHNYQFVWSNLHITYDKSILMSLKCPVRSLLNEKMMIFLTFTTIVNVNKWCCLCILVELFVYIEIFVSCPFTYVESKLVHWEFLYAVILLQYVNWIYKYLCNQFLSPLTLLVRIPHRCGVLNTKLCDKVCELSKRQVGSFLRVLRFPPPIKLSATI